MSVPARPNPFIDKRFIWALVASAILAGIALRSWHIFSEAMWLDEGYSAYAAAKGFDFLWHVVPRYETHPPFYYSLLRVWTLGFGDSLVALRALGLACGLATIGFIASAAHQLARLLDLQSRATVRYVALAAVLAALSPMLVEMTREVRPYPVLILVYAAAITVLVSLARRMNEGKCLGSGAYGLYLVLLALTLWLHNLGALYAASLTLAFALLCFRSGWRRSDWVAFFIGHALVLAIWAPALLILADQAPTWIKTTWLHFPPANLNQVILLLFIAPQAISIAAALFLTGATCIKSIGRPYAWRVTAALLSLALLPIALSVALSAWVTPVFILRTMTPVAVPAVLFFGLGLAQLEGKYFRLGIAAFLAVAIQMAISDIGQRRIGEQQKWYRALAWLYPRYRQGDMIYAYPNEGALPFRYAVRDKRLPIVTRPIPTDIPTLDGGPGSWNPTGSRGVVSLSRQRLEAIAEETETRRVGTVWLLRLGPWAYDKGDLFLHALERDRRSIGHYKDGPIDIIGLRRKDLTSVAPPEQPKP